MTEYCHYYHRTSNGLSKLSTWPGHLNHMRVCCSTLGKQRTRPKERAREGDLLSGMSVSLLAGHKVLFQEKNCLGTKCLRINDTVNGDLKYICNTLAILPGRHFHIKLPLSLCAGRRLGIKRIFFPDS